MEISSNNLIYNSLGQNDFHLYASLAMDQDVMKYITGRGLTIKEAEERFQKAIDDSRNYAEAGFFMVRRKPFYEFIGVAKLVPFGENQAEVGYMLLPEYWGKGYASEMTGRMITLAVEKRLVGELIGIVDPENPASIKVLTKLGFKLYETGEIDGLAAAYYKLKLKLNYNNSSKSRKL